MLKTMDQALARKLIEGEDDILTPEIKAEEKLYENTRCPMCGQGGCEKRVSPPRTVQDENGDLLLVSPFNTSSLLPDGFAHCINCGTNFNPLTGMIYKTEASMIHGPE